MGNKQSRDNRDKVVGFRVTNDEKQWLEDLARREERTVSDTVRRIVVREANKDK